jgi:small GTP-binding protein
MASEDIPRFKIVVLGNSGVGKTSLIQRWVSDSFSAQTKQTIGSNHQRKRVDIEPSGQADLYIWDTAGQERFHALTPLYTRSSDMAVLTAAVNDPSSFEQIAYWIDLITASCDVTPPIVLAVNKIDVGDDRRDEIHQGYGAQFRSIFFVSAKTGENCDALIQFVGNEAANFNRNQKQMIASNAKEVSERNDQCC